nr:uncharacterized protein LOC115257861 [Aedes albopictus]
MTRTNSSDVIRVLKGIFTRLGLPYVLTFDNAKNFSSQELKNYCIDYGIKLTHTTPYWPSANGEVERQNQSILKVLKISKQRDADWKEAIQDYVYMYSLTPHSVTNVAPAQLMFGRRFRDLIPHFQADIVDDGEVRDRDRVIKFNAKESRDKRVGAKESSLRIGDEVWMKNLVPQNKLDTAFLPTPARVVERHENSLVLETPDGQIFRRNTSHVKQANQSSQQSDQEVAIENNGGERPHCSPASTEAPEEENGKTSQQIKIQTRSVWCNQRNRTNAPIPDGRMVRLAPILNVNRMTDDRLTQRDECQLTNNNSNNGALH